MEQKKLYLVEILYDDCSSYLCHQLYHSFNEARDFVRHCFELKVEIDDVVKYKIYLLEDDVLYFLKSFSNE